jgi:uncharacterized membrane protein
MSGFLGSEKSRSIGFLLVSTLLGAIGQFLFKYSFMSSSFLVFLSLGLLSYMASTAVYFYVLSRVHLSWAYSIGGISYVFAVLMAHFFLLEYVPPVRWVGVIVIAVGVLLIGVS